MTTITITEQQSRSIVDGEDDGYEEVHRGKWAQNGKHQMSNVVVRRESDGTFWAITVTRYGSPFTDWDYHYDTSMTEVELVEVTTTAWKPKKDAS